MKRLIILWIIVVNPFLLCGQSTWSSWHTIYQEGGYPNQVKVQVSFKLSVCNGEYLRGYSFWRTNNEFMREKAYIEFKFDYLDCNGEIRTQSGLVELSKPGIAAEMGDWFLGYKLVGDIYDIKYKDYGSSQNNSFSNPASGGSTQPGVSEISFPGPTAQQTERDYLNKVEEADNLFSQKKYPEAKIAYQDAAEIIPGGKYQDYIDEMIQEIDTYKHNAEVEAEEKARLEEEKLEQERIAQEEQKLIEQGENLQNYREMRRNDFEDRQALREQAAADAQAAAVGLGLAAGGLIALGISNNTDINYYRGHSWHFGWNVGLEANVQPMIANTSSSTYTYNGLNSTVVDNSSQDIISPLGTGLAAGIRFHPILSEFVGIGGFINGTLGTTPVFLLGGGTGISGSNYFSSSEESYSYSKFDYGAELTLGVRPVKLLASYSRSTRFFDYSSFSSTDVDNGSNVQTSEMISESSLRFTEHRAGIGARFIPYENGITFDLLYAKALPQFDGIALAKTQTIYSAGVWLQSKFKIAVEAGLKYPALSNEIDYLDRTDSKRLYLAVNVLYCMDFFGNSYF